MRWMNLEPILQNEASQKEKNKFIQTQRKRYIYLWNLGKKWY